MSDWNIPGVTGDHQDDDLMAIADATGVTAPAPHPDGLRNYRSHPSIRQHLSDTNIAAVLSTWAREHAGLGATADDADTDTDGALVLLCSECGGGGLVEHQSPSGLTWSTTCRRCGGE